MRHLAVIIIFLVISLIWIGSSLLRDEKEHTTADSRGLAQSLVSTPISSLPAVSTISSKRSPPSMGNPRAPVTLVEYADFQCPYCRAFWETTLPQLKKDYIETGKVKFVYKNFAILGPDSINAANAALCAGEQNKFWEYHDYLYKNQSEGDLSEIKLNSYSISLGLDTTQFTQCITEKRYDNQIQTETDEAKNNSFTGTPAFLINNIAIAGTQPYSMFKTIINEQLKIR